MSSVLAAGAVGLTYADYGRTAPDLTQSIQLGKLLLTDDGAEVGQARSRIDKIGYAGAARVFGPALERDAASAYRWCDLGEALQATGDRNRAAFCYRRAAELAPGDLQILLDLGDYYAAVGNVPLATRYLSRILGGPPHENILTDNVFTYFERMGVRQKGLLAEAIPDAANARAYLRYLIAETGPDGVGQLWNWLSAKGYDDDESTVEYVNFMFDRKLYSAAEEAWNTHFHPRSPVFNGGFERELTGGIPDWRLDEYSPVKVSRDQQFAYEGRFSLRVEFPENDNPEYRGPSEFLFVQPGQYRLDAYVRTNGVTSDQGVRFRIEAPNGKLQAAETGQLTGTNGWTRLTAQIAVPAGVPILDIGLVRHRSYRIDNQLSGTVWIDAVALTRVR